LSRSRARDRFHASAPSEAR